MKVKLSTIKLFIACSILNLFLFSRGSLGGYMFSGREWRRLSYVGILLIAEGASYKIKHFNRYLSLVLLMMMTIIIFTWHNWDLKHNYFQFFYIIDLLFFFVIQNNKRIKWFAYFLQTGIFVGIFYSFWTWVSYLFPSFYMKYIFPIFKDIRGDYILRVMSQGGISGLTSHYSYNGQYISYGLGLIVCCLWFNQNKKKGNFIDYFIFLFVAGALLLCGKRGHVLWCLISIFIIYYIFHCDKPTTRFFKMTAGGIGLVFLFFIASFFIPSLGTVVTRTIESSSSFETLSNGRIALWRQAVAGFLRNPLWGNGWSWFRYNNTYGTSFHVHNIYLQLFCEVGIIGATPFFLFFIITIFHSIKLLKKNIQQKTISNFEELLLCCSLYIELFFLLYGLNGSNLYDVQCYGPYFIYCAISEYLWYKSKRNAN